MICVSQSDRSSVLGYRLVPETRLHVINNGIDFESVGLSRADEAEKERLRSELGLTPGIPVLGTVARLHHQKGIPDLIYALEEVRRTNPQIRLVIVGGGPEEERVKKIIAERGLTNNVILCGEREDARRLMSLFDVFVLSSLWEGLPYVLLEAAAMGLPVLATAALGVAEVVEDGKTGLLAPVNRPSDLARGAVRLLNDRDLAHRLGRNLYETAFSRFSLDRMVAQTAALYEKVLQDSGN